MSTTTDQPTLAGADIANALRDLALEIEHGALDGIRMYPDQALSITVSTESAAGVHQAAGRLGVPDKVEQHPLPDGAVHTAVEIGYGEGTDRATYSPAAYRNAVVLRIIHVLGVTR